MFSNTQCICVVLVLMIILLVIRIQRHTKRLGVTVVRYSRPTCPYCVSSQAAWDQFKQENSVHNVADVVDVNLDDKSEHTAEWLSKYRVNTVPTVIRIDGATITEHKGPRTADAYGRFAATGQN